jgi:hypothetical protein
MSVDSDREFLSSDLVARELLVGLNFCHQTDRVAKVRSLLLCRSAQLIVAQLCLHACE